MQNLVLFIWLLLGIQSVSAESFQNDLDQRQDIRQYIQCAANDSWDRAVINLNSQQSTFFVSTGVHDPDEIRVLSDLDFVQEKLNPVTNQLEVIYETRPNDPTSAVVHRLWIPKIYIGVASRLFQIRFRITGSSGSREYSMDCFSSLYDDN